MSFDKVYEWDEMRWGKKKAEMRRIHSLLTPSRGVKLRKKHNFLLGNHALDYNATS